MARTDTVELLQHLHKTSYGHLQHRGRGLFRLVNCPECYITLTTNNIHIKCSVAEFRLLSGNGKLLPSVTGYDLSVSGFCIADTSEVKSHRSHYHNQRDLRCFHLPDYTHTSVARAYVDDKLVFTMLCWVETVFFLVGTSLCSISAQGKWLELESFLAIKRRKDT